MDLTPNGRDGKSVGSASGRALPLLLLVLALILLACGEGSTADAPRAPAPGQSSTTAATPFPPDAQFEEEVEDAVTRGVSFVAPQLSSIDIASASLFDYIHRNWEVPGLSDVRPQIEERARIGGLVDDEAMLARLALPDADHVEPDRQTEPTTEVLSAALHCDRRPMDDAVQDRLSRLVDAGGYDTTHAALAIGWMGELGCPVPEQLRAESIERIATELHDLGPDAITDLATEQSALLLYLGARSRLPSEWLTRLLDAQRSDGGWGEPSGPATWHMTLLAIWTLEGLNSPGVGAPMILAACQQLPLRPVVTSSASRSIGVTGHRRRRAAAPVARALSIARRIPITHEETRRSA